MRCAVVRSSTLTKYNRMDAGFYLNPQPLAPTLKERFSTSTPDEPATEFGSGTLKAQIKNNRVTLKRAAAREKALQNHKRREKYRLAKMREKGEVKDVG